MGVFYKRISVPSNYAGLVLAASMTVFQTVGASSNLVSCSN